MTFTTRISKAQRNFLLQGVVSKKYKSTSQWMHVYCKQCLVHSCRLIAGLEEKTHLTVGDKGAEDGFPVFSRNGLVALVLGQRLLALGPTAAHPNARL